MLIYEKIRRKDKEKATRFKDSILRFNIYGDDSGHAAQEEFFDDIIGETSDDYPLGTFQRMCEQYFGILFKLSQTGLFRRKCAVSPFLTVVKPVIVNGVVVSHEVLQQGPIFLKRSFVNVKVNGEYQVMPWRHENDYFHRLAVTAKTNGYEPDKWRSKYLGLMIDTMGTNALSYKLCKSMYYGLTNLPAAFKVREQVFQPEIKKIEVNIFKDVPTKEQLEAYIDEGEERLRKSFDKTGLHPMSKIKAIDQRWLFDQFVWDEKWRTAWAVHYKIDMYNPYGELIQVMWEGETNALEYLESIEAEYADTI